MADPFAKHATSEIPGSDPLALFDAWLAQAQQAEPDNHNAMALATATPDGMPSVRMVLLKDHGPDGFTFYTHATSRKGGEITANPHAALLFYWKGLARQTRIEGPLVEVSADQADAYFHSRARASQLGALASDQSAPLASRADFVAAYRDADAVFASEEIPRPPRWTGFTLTPRRIEFWLDRDFRLHDRRVFTRPDSESDWTQTLLYP